MKSILGHDARRVGVFARSSRQTPSTCTDDPCDPLCTNYVDNGSGYDGGAGLVPTDAGGLTLSQADGSTCQGLQCQQVGCSEAGVLTTITGRVVGGTNGTFGTPDPVPNVLVYVPNAPLSPFAAGVQCDSTCSSEVSGSPIAATTTNYDGTFTLTNVPAGTNIPIVIQLGRWRREVQFTVPQCTSTPVGDIHMPRNKNDSTPPSSANIPFTAVSTGSVDALECVLLKMGVDQAEFTKPGGGGRIEIYDGNGASAGSSTPGEGTLVPNLPNSTATLDEYDQVLFPCWGGQYDKTANQLANVQSYTNAGGRMFATHYLCTWLYNERIVCGHGELGRRTRTRGTRSRAKSTRRSRADRQLSQWMVLLNALDMSATRRPGVHDHEPTPRHGQRRVAPSQRVGLRLRSVRAFRFTTRSTPATTAAAASSSATSTSRTHR